MSRFPVQVQADLDPNLSRWLWLVKWLLLIPHYLILVGLWIAFAVMTLVAYVAVLFTGRYPAAIDALALALQCVRVRFVSTHGAGAHPLSSGRKTHSTGQVPAGIGRWPEGRDQRPCPSARGTTRVKVSDFAGSVNPSDARPAVAVAVTWARSTSRKACHEGACVSRSRT